MTLATELRRERDRQRLLEKGAGLLRREALDQRSAPIAEVRWRAAASQGKTGIAAR